VERPRKRRTDKLVESSPTEPDHPGHLGYAHNRFGFRFIYCVHGSVPSAVRLKQRPLERGGDALRVIILSPQAPLAASPRAEAIRLLARSWRASRRFLA